VFKRDRRPIVAALVDGAALVKFRYHVTFINAAFGALIFAARPDRTLAWRLLALYLSFNVLLYSGLYAINDLADRESDGRHPLKRQRPVASGRVSVPQAERWAGIFLVSGMATGALFGTRVLWCYVAAVAINVAYSFGGRNVVYLDVVLNALPHVVRFLMGVMLVGRVPPVTHLAAFLLAAVALSCLRRLVERDVPGWEARPALRAWSRKRLDLVMAGSLTAFAGMAIWRGASAPGFYAALAGTAVVLIGGAHRAPFVRRTLRWVWTH
jgi:decaprenyl-phosphate phosphoribosyltransferase